MGLNGSEQAAVCRSCAAIVKEEETLSQAPKRGRSEFVEAGGALGNIFGESRSHVMHEKVGKQRGVLIAERRSESGS